MLSNNSFWQSIRAVGQEAWIKLLSRMNALILFVCAGLVMLNQTNPGLVNTLVKTMTPTEQAIASLLFCCLVQFALHRVQKKGQ